MKENNVFIESCPHSNLAIKTTGVTDALTHIKTLLDAGVEVGLGSDDAVCWGMTPGQCMRDQARLVEARFGMKALIRMSMSSLNAFPPVNADLKLKEVLAKEIAEATEPDDVPLLDMHAHLAGSIPGLQQIYDEVTVQGQKHGTAQTFVSSPADTQRNMIRFKDDGYVVACRNQWADLKAFSADTYTHQLGIVLSAGVSAVTDMLLKVASDGVAHRVFGIALNIPLPSGTSSAWRKFYGAQLFVGALKMKAMGYAVEYNLALIRNASVGLGIPVIGAAKEINANFQEEHMGNAMIAHWEALAEKLGSDTVVSPHPAKLPTLKTLRDVAMLACACANNKLNADLRMKSDQSHQTDLKTEMKAYIRGFKDEKISIEKTPLQFRFGADKIFLDEGMPVVAAYFTAVETVVDLRVDALMMKLSQKLLCSPNPKDPAATSSVKRQKCK